MTNPPPDFAAILRVLQAHDAEFIIVGGVCAVLQGVPVTTADLDVVHRRSAKNVERLLAALDELEAVSRLDQRRLRPQASHLLSPGHQLLATNCGLLDLLGEVAGGGSYETLIDGSEQIQLDGRSVHLLSLEQLIETKTSAGRAKDHAVLPLIRHVMEEKKRRDS